MVKVSSSRTCHSTLSPASISLDDSVNFQPIILKYTVFPVGSLTVTASGVGVGVTVISGVNVSVGAAVRVIVGVTLEEVVFGSSSLDFPERSVIGTTFPAPFHHWNSTQCSQIELPVEES